MTTNKHDFEELAAPKAAAAELGISVATLRKYSLIVEKVTGNPQYFARTKQKARLYHQKDIDDLKAFHRLSKNSGLTLQEAARQIYAVSDQKTSPEAEKPAEYVAKDVMDTKEVVKLLNRLQQTISNQNEAIVSLQKQLNVIQKQNANLIEAQKQLSAPKDNSDKFAELPDISGVVINDSPDEEKPKDDAAKREEVKEDMHKSQEEMHDEIISKAKENAKKRATANVHRTLEDMQLPGKKEHWWQRIFKF